MRVIPKLPITSELKHLVSMALNEDLVLGDPSTELLFDTNDCGKAHVIARESLIACVGPIPNLIFSVLCEDNSDSAVRTVQLIEDGKELLPGDKLLELSGPCQYLLQAERVLLNFLQRMCSIASHVREIVDIDVAVPVIDTRKTTPAFRSIEKFAVRVGGALNHRSCLGDLIMLKDTHIDLAGGDFADILSKIFQGKGFYTPVEIEIRSLQELDALFAAMDKTGFAPKIIMLDNFSMDDLDQAIAVIRDDPRDILIEVSGGITVDTLTSVAKLKPDAISMGSLIYGAKPKDLAMKILKSS